METREIQRNGGDSHFRVTGPAVTSMQAAFPANWLEATGGTIVRGKDVFRAGRSGPLGGQLIISTQPSGSTGAPPMMLMAISAAEKNIRIGMAYFDPDDVMLQQLLDARVSPRLLQLIVLRRAIHDLQFQPGPRPHQLSISVGGVSFDGRKPFEELYRHADQRLYAAKRAGRNRVDVIALPALAA